jgi:AraC family transcriptional regulator, ethanolamine operon transcriptional activator
MASANPPVPNAAMRWSRGFTDLDEMAESVAAWDDQYEQFSPGSLRADIAVTASPSLEILTQSWNLGLSNHGAAPEGRRSFAFPMIQQRSLRFNGAVAEGGVVLTGRGGSEYHLLTDGALRLVIVSFERAMIDRRIEERFGCDARTLDEPRLLRARSADAVREAGWALDALGCAMVEAGPETLAQIEDQATDILLSAIAPPAAARAATPRESLARRIEETLRNRLLNPPDIGALCEITGAPERTLHLAFHETYGSAPMTYLRLLRLNAVRRVLLRAEERSVTTAATRFGFFHLGRFASDYSRLFEETPSATLRRRAGPGRRSDGDTAL